MSSDELCKVVLTGMLSCWIIAVVQVEAPLRTMTVAIRGREMEVVHSIKSGHIISPPILALLRTFFICQTLRGVCVYKWIIYTVSRLLALHRSHFSVHEAPA